MGKVDYDERQHALYAIGRQMSPDALQIWMDAFARHMPERRPLAWLDLGSGTGRMTPSLANAFGGPVYGVEPAGKMRSQAIAHAGHPAVTYEAGSADKSHCQMPRATQHCCSSSGTTSSTGMSPPGKWAGWLSPAASSLCRRTSPTGCLTFGGYISSPNG